ncbi:hypothetical protein DL240_09480 [Lujinxingia litoralis]|uniref:Uncharacterized protein n=1 Tax=Lujinxingia litoralis TaxID=2211119 RepID=A0A328C6K7_9DELT|nr:hypothetical protein DL240_09480 [Lujinxingia litoralis]
MPPDLIASITCIAVPACSSTGPAWPTRPPSCPRFAKSPALPPNAPAPPAAPSTPAPAPPVATPRATLVTIGPTVS